LSLHRFLVWSTGLKSMVGFLQRSIVAAAVMAAALAGCSAGQLGDTLPNSMGGLPEGAPARPNTTRQFPAVHDMPSPRPTTPLSAEDQLKLEKDLQEARTKQEAIAAQPDPGSTPAPVAAKKPPAVKKQAPAAASGDAKTSGAKTNP
jgi:hypothetical protein